MTIDLTGGLDDELEFVFVDCPDEPEMRESVNAWIWDDSGAVGMPRIGVEVVADSWGTNELQFNLSLADGRVCSARGTGAAHDPLGADGVARNLGAGPLSFELVEPFGGLRMRFRDTVALSTVAAQIQGDWSTDGEPVPIEADIELRPAVPPWMNGSLLADAKHVMETQEEGDLMGHPWRFEQLCRAVGTVRVGDETFELNGGANRIRRQSIRRLATFWGHAWQAALFPSGRGFAYITYPPRADGKPTYNEGYIFEGDGALVPARAVESPWLRELHAAGEDVSCVLETEAGERVTIEGVTANSTFMVMPPEVGGGMQLQQTTARYTWDGESAGGMLERSSVPDAMST